MCELHSKVNLRPHQLRVVDSFQFVRGKIIDHTVGSGKTLTSIACIDCYLQEFPDDEVHIITPKSLTGNYQSELEKYGLDFSDFFFYTYQSFANTWKEKRFPKNSLIVIDEAHNLRTKVHYDINTKEMKLDSRSSITIEACTRARKVLLLTATPIVNSPFDIVNLIAMVDGDYPLTESQFTLSLRPMAFKTLYEGKIDFYEEPDNEHYPLLRKFVTYIQMTPQYFEEYSKVEQAKSSYLKSDNPFVFLTIVREATNSLGLECLKCNYILRKVTEKGRVARSVIYSNFLAFGVNVLQEQFDDRGIAHVQITGEMSKKQRLKAQADYNADRVQVIFITQAGREGINLLLTENLFIMDLPWNEATEDQIEGRVKRYGSHDSLPIELRIVNVYYLVLTKPKSTKVYRIPSADELMLNIIEEKEQDNNDFIDRLKKLERKSVLRSLFA